LTHPYCAAVLAALSSRGGRVVSPPVVCVYEMRRLSSMMQ
jgi:hypothetical protein